MSRVHRIAPAHLFRGSRAVEDAWAAVVPAASTAGSLHARRVLVVEGEFGRARLGSRWDAAISACDVEARSITHRGPCTDGSMSSVADAAASFGADAIVGVGGGRVLDVAKGAADRLGIAFAAFPTSPATCAAVTPLVVRYDASGRFVESVGTRSCPDVVALDPSVLADAPDRLLAAGILDALAKVYEVRHTSERAAMRSATAGAALALCDDLEAAILRDADVAFAVVRHEGDSTNVRSEPAPDPLRTDRSDRRRPGTGSIVATRNPRVARERLAEACVLMPGIIAGLAGADAKLAAAHPVHNALTTLPGSHASLHGEIVGFGILTQLVLAGWTETDVRGEARRYARMGVACHLDALGCGEALAGSAAEIATAVLASAPFRAAFPEVGADALLTAMRSADALAGEEYRGWTQETG